MTHLSSQIPASRCHKILLSTALAFGISAVAGCANMQGDENEGARKGALTGAALGLAMGAITGDASLALKAAAVGGVAGAGAGTMADYENKQKNKRTETIAGGLAGNNNNAAQSQPENWPELEAMAGKWKVAIWAYNANGEKITATAEAYGQLQSFKQLTMSLENIDSTALAAPIRGQSVLSYSPDSGYEIRSSYSSDKQIQRYVGEKPKDQDGYHFYYAGSDENNAMGDKRSESRIELRLIGKDVIIIDTWQQADKQEAKVQSYRFTRA